MKFYREATGRDFQLAEFDLEKRIPLRVRIQINQEPQQMAKATKLWREYSGVSLQHGIKTLTEYTAFRKAFSDFLKGEKVYTDY